jgi:hypothetical protein
VLAADVQIRSTAKPTATSSPAITIASVLRVLFGVSSDGIVTKLSVNPVMATGG